MIQIYRNKERDQRGGERDQLQAGAPIASVAAAARDASLTDWSLLGIPGTVEEPRVYERGAYGGEIKNAGNGGF